MRRGWRPWGVGAVYTYHFKRRSAEVEIYEQDQGPTTIGRAKNKRVESKFALLGPDAPQNMRLEFYVRMV